eukprot:2012288-Amphidinium_carterae.1
MQNGTPQITGTSRDICARPVKKTHAVMHESTVKHSPLSASLGTKFVAKSRRSSESQAPPQLKTCTFSKEAQADNN